MLRAGYGIKALQYSWGNYVVKLGALGGKEVERRCNAVSYRKNGDPNFEGVYAGEWAHRDTVYGRQSGYTVCETYTQARVSFIVLCYGTADVVLPSHPTFHRMFRPYHSRTVAGGNVDPWEVVFFKANRNVTINEMDRRTFLTDNYKLGAGGLPAVAAAA